MAKAEKILDNAEDVIEKFGGIRPMSSKTDIPVTTIQGWKKRGNIPESRYEEILKFAAEHNIDLAESGARAANENSNTSAPVQSELVTHESVSGFDTTQKTESAHNVQDDGFVELTDIKDDDLMKIIDEKVKAMEARAVTKSVIISAILIALAAAAFVLLILPNERGFENDDARLAALEQQVQEVESQQSMFGEFDERLASLQEKTEEALSQAQQKGQQVIDENAPAIEDRIVELEERFSDVAGSETLMALRSRFESLRASTEGQNLLDESVNELNSLLDGDALASAGEDQVNDALEAARQKSADVQQAFEGVPQQDLKAAAMLLGLGQFRSALNRDNQPFENDLALLKKLAGPENEDLQASLDKLAPHAEQGVLTPAGLGDELRGLSGDILVSSLSGEDVSIKEKAQARLSNLIEVEKDGELVSGTPTQAKINKAETMIENGDIQGAIAEMQGLEGDALTTASPWIEKAQATLTAQNVQSQLSKIIDLKAIGLGGPQPYDFNRRRR